MSKKYQRLAVIGSGSFGKAWLVTGAGQSKKLVSKEIKVSQLTEKETDQCITEVMVLASCNHGNIIQYVDAYVEERALYIVMEFADGGDLQRRILRQNGIFFTKELILEWFVQIMMALEYIHHRNILHRDLKSQNVFLTGNDVIKLGDFGIAKVLQGQDDHALTTIGTPFYISPEICQKKPYNTSSDMWAAGCLLFEMCLLRVPFNAPDFTSLVLKILQGNYDPIPSYFGPLLQQLVSSLLLVQPSARMSAAEVLKMPEISNIGRKLLSKHCVMYRENRSRSSVSKNRNERSRSRSPKYIDPNTSSVKYNENREIKQTNKVDHITERSRKDIIRNAHPGRSLTPDLRRVRKVERQQSEPRRHSYNNEKENISNDNALNKEENKVNDSGVKRVAENRSCVLRENSVERERNPTTPTAVEENVNKNNSAKVCKKTFVLKGSSLRRLSQASPKLSETICQQRASLSLDMDTELKIPTASLFSCENGHANVTLASEAKKDVDHADQSEDEVFETPNMVSEVPGTGGERVGQTKRYETGPFDIEGQRRKIDSVTYIVKPASINNNCDVGILDVNQVLYLAASVNKQNHQLARDILHDCVVRCLGDEAGKTLITMVTKQLDAGLSYQSLVKNLTEKEKEILAVVIYMYNLAL